MKSFEFLGANVGANGNSVTFKGKEWHGVRARALRIGVDGSLAYELEVDAAAWQAFLETLPPDPCAEFLTGSDPWPFPHTPTSPLDAIETLRRKPGPE